MDALPMRLMSATFKGDNEGHINLGPGAPQQEENMTKKGAYNFSWTGLLSCGCGSQAVGGALNLCVWL